MKKTITIIFPILLTFFSSCFYVEDVSDVYFYVNLGIDGETWNINSDEGTFSCHQNWLWDFDWNCDWRSDDYLLKFEFSCNSCYSGCEPGEKYESCYAVFTNKETAVTEVYISKYEYTEMINSWDSGNITTGSLDGAVESYLQNDPDEDIPVNFDGKFKVPHDTAYLD